MTSLDVLAFGFGLGAGCRLVYQSLSGPPSAFESWCWRVMEGRA